MSKKKNGTKNVPNENEKTSKIIVYDAIMGSGKTYDAIKRMKKNKKNYLYVTPFLDEVDRIKREVPGIHEPKIVNISNHNETPYISYKRDSLLRMTNYQISLVCTHSLFQKLHRKDYTHFENYNLILDEVLTPIKLINMTPDDVKIAFNEGLLVENKKTGEVTFTGDNYRGKFYSDLKKYCDTSNVIFINECLLVWSFPTEIFKCFKSVTILTYLFEGSLLSNYFKYYNITYKIIKKTKEEETKIKEKIKSQLKIYEGICNNIGEYPSAFSVNWLKNKTSIDFKSIKTTVANLVERKFKTNSASNGFTTFNEFSSKLKGKGYSKGFITVNERATNKYANKDTMIYLANRYLNPNIIDFFRIGSVFVNQDKWALAELLQWLWRGSIRRGKPMNVFIPSKRMRTLLFNWLNGNYNNNLLYQVA